MELTKEQCTAVKDMSQSYGWKVIVADLLEEKAIVERQFMSCTDMGQVNTIRGKIMLIDYLIMLPDRLVSSYQEEAPVVIDSIPEPVIMSEASMQEAFDN